MRRLVVILSVLALALGAAAPAATAGAAGTKPQFFVDESKLPFDALPGLDSQRYWGVHNGAGYRVEVPANWNGDLVMWAHGFRGSGLELTVDNHPLRPALLAAGFAWAASSYSKNDYDVAQGVKDTHALTKLFNGLVGKPDKVYMTGASMGGHITGVVIEQYPNTYDAAMPICGVMGDYELFDYFADFALVAQALTGNDAGFPFPEDYTGVDVPEMKAALGPAFPFVLNGSGQALAAVTALRSGGFRPLFDFAFAFWNGLVPGDFLFTILEGSDGTVPRAPGFILDNAATVYQFDLDPALSPQEQTLNDSVLRFSPQPQARKAHGLRNVPAVSGDISIPVLTLHTIGDLFVPMSMEQIYAERVTSHGAADLLVQRAIRDVGHCSFTPDELVSAFFDLVMWVEAGVKPGGDDFLDPFAVADPDFGCAYTRNHPYYLDTVDPTSGVGLPVPACSA